MKHSVTFIETEDPAQSNNAVRRFHADPWVKAARQGRVLTARRRVELLLKAVHTGTLSGEERLSLQSGAHAKAEGASKFHLPMALRTVYRDVLSDFVRSVPKVRTNFGQMLCIGLESSVTGTLRAEMTAKGELLLNYQAFGVDQVCGLDYALLLLLASNGPFARDLCMCKQCGRFFLLKRLPHGRPRREFCSDAHGRKFFDSKATERVRKSRADRAEARKLRMDVDDYRQMKKAGASPEEWKKRRQQK